MKRVLVTSYLLLSAAICLAQWNTDRIMTIGRNALYFEDYVLSIQYFNRVISVKPYLAEPYMYRGMAKAQLGDYRGADNDCTEAITRNPFIPQAYYTRGFARRKLGYYQEAVDDFTKALEFSPNSGFLLLNRMDAQAAMEHYEDAMADLDEYMRLNPKITELNYEKGQLQLALKGYRGGGGHLRPLRGDRQEKQPGLERTRPAPPATGRPGRCLVRLQRGHQAEIDLCGRLHQPGHRQRAEEQLPAGPGGLQPRHRTGS